MQKRFLQMCESAVTRHTRGGFLVGDYIKFVDKATTNNEYKSLGDNVKELISDMLASGLHMRVVGINDLYPARYPGNPDTMNGMVSVNIALDNGGGRYSHYCTVPSCCLQTIDYAPNVAPPFSDTLVRPNGTIITPVEYKPDSEMIEVIKQTRKSDQGGTTKDVETSLAKKQVKIPASSAKDPTFAKPKAYKESYITEYMKGY